MYRSVQTPCFIPGTNTTLYVNFTLIIKKLKNIDKVKP